MLSPVTRRTFVGHVTRAAVGITIVPRHVLGRGYRAPSDTLRMACIGIGGRGRDDVRGVAGESVVALCDVDWNRAEDAFRGYPKAKKYRDFRELLEKEEKHIDAVVVATPDHTHAVAASMALKLGKHVYVEKPLARTLHEVRWLVEQARRSKAATQMGNQGHAGAGTRQLREYIEAGVIGTVREIHYWTNRPIWPQGIDRPLEAYNAPPWLDWDLWLGPAPFRPFAPAYAPFRWRGWWDFGTGALGDIACHAMDAAFWTLDLRYPSRILVETTRLYTETAPRIARLEFEFPARGTRPPVRLIWRDGELSEPRPKWLPVEQAWPYGDVGSQLWIGTDGQLLTDAYGDRLLLLDQERDRQLKASPPAEKYPRSPGVYAEWISACKDGPRAGSNFTDHAGPLTEMVLLGNLAIRTGQPLDIDPETGRVTNTVIPEEYIRPEYRKGWKLYE